MARRQIAPTNPAWVGDLPVFERSLANGLKALALPRPGAPTVVVDLYYPVGSVDEPPGKSGLAHFLEHMLFKGTERFPKGQIDELAYLAAGMVNAETGEDATHYWFAFPRGRWELALAVEADRMLAARFDPREVEVERTVIAEERAREMDSPLGRLDQTHLAVSYLVHPYRNPVLGWPDDLRRATVEDLHGFYRDHYRPDGAVLIVVGDIDPARALDQVEKAFGKLPRGPEPRPRTAIVEPRQTGRRDFTLVESEGAARGVFGWHSVPEGHVDTPALDVLSDLLSVGRRSRLWDRLVERERLATWVDASQEGSRLAGQFLVSAEAAPGVDPRRVEAVVVQELQKLAVDGPTEAELARSRNRLEAAWRWEQEDLPGLAAGLGHVALWDDWRAWQASHRAALAIRAEDVRRVASMYLVEGGLTAGWSLPRPAGSLFVLGVAPVATTPEPAATPRVDATRPRAALKVPALGSTLSDYTPRRDVLANGLRVLTERRPGTGTVALDLVVDAGQVREARPGLAHLVGRMREEGTTTRSAEAVSMAVEDVGGTLDVGSTGVSLRVRAEDLAMAVELLADIALRPAFPAESLAWTKRRIGHERRADRDDPSYKADQLFRSLVYGDHPAGRDPRAGALAPIGPAEIRAHHKRWFTADNAFLVAVGDFDEAELAELARKRLGRWAPSGKPGGPIETPVAAAKPKVRRVFHPGEQVHLLIGHLGVARNHPDIDALAILDYILGSGPGFTDRLSRTLRDELGLAYSVGGGMTDSADVVPGMLRVYVGTGPDQADRAASAVVETIASLARGEFSDEEVDRARRYLAGSWVFDYQTVGQRADRLVELERWGLPLDEPLRWPDRVGTVPAARVREAAARHLHPDRLIRVEYGPIRPR